MTPRSPAPSMRPPAIAPLSSFKRAPPCPGRDPWLMAHTTMRAGYSESSNTPTPPLRSRGCLDRPATGRAIDEHWRRKRMRPAGYSEDVAGEPPGAGHAALTRVQGGTLPDGDRRNAGDTT